MSIRPVDMQIMVQKTPDVAKPVINEARHPEVQQHVLTEKITKESLQNEERVLQTERPEDEAVNKDGKGGAEYRRRRDKRERRKKESGEAPEPPKSGFDISI